MNFICTLNWTVLSNRGRLKISSPRMSGLYFVWSEVQFKAQDKSWTNHQKPTCHNSSPLWPTATQCITWPRPRQEYQPQPQEGSDSPTTHPWLTHDSIHDSSTTHFTTHLRLTHDSLMTPYDSLWLVYDSVTLSRTHTWVNLLYSWSQSGSATKTSVEYKREPNFCPRKISRPRNSSVCSVH